MPTLKEIASRIKAVSSIKDTTEAMKMIAQAKVAKAEARLHFTRSFSREIESVFNDLTAVPEEAEAVDVAEGTSQLVAMGTDQGLCGSINSGMGRAVTTKLTSLPENTTLYALGTRCASNVQSKFGSKMDGAIFGSQKHLSFRQSLAMADIFLNEPIPTTRTILYNRMLTMATFEVAEVQLKDRSALEKFEEGVYEVEGGTEVLEDFYDYHFAVMMWRLYSEVETSELSSRAMAMTNSTTAASEMESELKLVYSKLRQEQITTEIIEISTGATQTLKANAKN